jgi:hypothetical protein
MDKEQRRLARKRYKLAHPDKVKAEKKRYYERCKLEREFFKRLSVPELVSYFKDKYGTTSKVSKDINQDCQEKWAVYRGNRPKKYTNTRITRTRNYCNKIHKGNGTSPDDYLYRWGVRD